MQTSFLLLGKEVLGHLALPVRLCKFGIAGVGGGSGHTAGVGVEVDGVWRVGEGGWRGWRECAMGAIYRSSGTGIKVASTVRLNVVGSSSKVHMVIPPHPPLFIHPPRLC
ncbi:hypothetical protein CVT26_010689 [Gymnopilus dilepis]|uniref:Uncharacterized protein n=1 Tax=Gymnopilus dilepis TaxID=231916 RepID=A0A409Y0R5_9AGAR|nr:hypothetical protein CVT26_010689 [Gymnopilus dilepis]